MKANIFISKLTVISGILLILSINGFAQDVRYNFLPGIDFSKYKTYKWVEVQGAEYPDQLLDGQIKRSIEAQLSTKGLTKTEADNPDLVVAYQLAITQEKQWNAYSTNDGYWGWGGWGGWGGSSTTATSSTINVGTLNLDFYDTALKKQVWRGEATKTLKQQKDPIKLQRNIDKAMAKLLKNYPPLAMK